MSLLSIIGAVVCALLVGIVGGCVKGHELGEAKVQREWDAAALQEHKALDEANVAAYTAAQQLERERATQHVRIVYRDKEVTRAIDASPVWRDGALPDGVRDELAAAAADATADPAVADGAVPAASAPGSENERRSGAGLPGHLDGLAGMPDHPPSSR